MNTEQLRAEFEAWWKKEGQYCRAGGGEYEKTFAYRAYQAGRAALQSQDREDADRLQAMAAEWDRARRGADSHMPIWENLCEAIGADADGAGMREAIDHARRVEGEGE